MTKTNVAVAMGGYSSEFEISVQSGMVVCESLDSEKFNIYPFHILKEGWFYVSLDGKRHPIDKGDFSFNDGKTKVIPDVVFNTIHGTPGEDGYIAAYLELLNIPQTSSDFYEAALSFNKRDCLTVAKNFGIKCANSVYITRGIPFNTAEILDTVGLPCFVKPNRAGSSFGISKVNKEEDLDGAILQAFEEDHEVLIETGLIGTEVSVGVFRKGNELIAFSPTEIVSQNDFFDYEAKYLGKSEEITPARISVEEIKAAQAEAKKIYQHLNMKGITRSDFIIQNGVPYFIEINTTPGLSKESIIPKQVREAKMNLGVFFELLIKEALKES